MCPKYSLKHNSQLASFLLKKIRWLKSQLHKRAFDPSLNRSIFPLILPSLYPLLFLRSPSPLIRPALQVHQPNCVSSCVWKNMPSPRLLDRLSGRHSRIRPSSARAECFTVRSGSATVAGTIFHDDWFKEAGRALFVCHRRTRCVVFPLVSGLEMSTSLLRAMYNHVEEKKFIIFFLRTNVLVCCWLLTNPMEDCS